MATPKILTAQHINPVRFPNFTAKQLACPCCNEINLNAAFIDQIQAARKKTSTLFRVKPGGCCRCGKFQAHLVEEKKTARFDSRHLMTRPNGTTAIDFLAENALVRGDIMVALMSVGIHSITIYESRGFIHVDDYEHNYVKVVL